MSEATRKGDKHMADETPKPPRKTITSKAVKRTYKNKRDAALNEAAKRAGYESWSKLEAAVYKGAGVTIPPKQNDSSESV